MYMFLGKDMPSEKGPIPVTQSKCEQPKTEPYSCIAAKTLNEVAFKNDSAAQKEIAPRTAADKGRQQTKRTRKGKAMEVNDARRSNDLGPQFRDHAIMEPHGHEGGGGVEGGKRRKQKATRKSEGDEEATGRARVANIPSVNTYGHCLMLDSTQGC